MGPKVGPNWPEHRSEHKPIVNLMIGGLLAKGEAKFMANLDTRHNKKRLGHRGGRTGGEENAAIMKDHRYS